MYCSYLNSLNKEKTSELFYKNCLINDLNLLNIFEIG
jgi:hypothetical protein